MEHNPYENLHELLSMLDYKSDLEDFVLKMDDAFNDGIITQREWANLYSSVCSIQQ